MKASQAEEGRDPAAAAAASLPAEAATPSSSSSSADASTSSSSSTFLSCICPDSMTTRQKLILWVLMTATLTSSLAVCLFPPFFPRLAEEKGWNATAYGFIIGTNCATSFVVTPFIGKNLGRIGVRFALILGIFVGGVCCLLSGFLEFFRPSWEFVAAAVLIRVVHATGNAAVITATFTFTAIEFQDSVARVFSLTRATMNLAQMFGPSVGGLLHGLDGFYLPFVVMGSIQILMAIACIPLLPECIMKPPQNTSRIQGRNITIRSILSIPKIWFSFFTFIVATACNGFLSINLERQVLSQFGLVPSLVGLIFGLKDGANSVASPIWGYFCDKNRHRTVKPYIVASATIAAGSFFLLGASSVIGINFKMSIPLVVAALVLNGVGIGGEQVAGIMDALHEAVNAGFPDDPAMHGLIAGLWSSLSGIGRFVSRSGSGAMVDFFGFKVTAAMACGLQCLVACITFAYIFLFEIRLKRTKKVRWDDVTIVEEGSNDDVFFTESHSPTESLMGRSVHVTRHIGCRRHHRNYGTLAMGSSSMVTTGSLPVAAIRRYPLNAAAARPNLVLSPETAYLHEEVEAAAISVRACSLR